MENDHLSMIYLLNRVMFQVAMLNYQNYQKPFMDFVCPSRSLRDMFHVGAYGLTKKNH